MVARQQDGYKARDHRSRLFPVMFVATNLGRQKFDHNQVFFFCLNITRSPHEIKY